MNDSALVCVSPAFPSDPVLEDSGPVLLGQEAKFRCDVINVFSANQLRVRWPSGNTTLMSELFQFSGSLQNISSVLKHRVNEVQQQLTCTVELLTQDGNVWRSRRTSVPLQVHCEWVFIMEIICLCVVPEPEQLLSNSGFNPLC